jgi:pimeloyl-ACP methyl ester carboxylesterase
MPFTISHVQTSDLLVTHLEDGASDGWPTILTHGFPYDVHAFDEVVPLLVEQGARVFRPFVRDFGPTSFLSTSAMRSGQQAALERDLIEVLDALGIQGAIVAGSDWGWACIVCCCCTMARPDWRARVLCQLRHRGPRTVTKSLRSCIGEIVLVSAPFSNGTWPRRSG